MESGQPQEAVPPAPSHVAELAGADWTHDKDVAVPEAKEVFKFPGHFKRLQNHTM